MSLSETRLRFPSERVAEQWFEHLRSDWVVTGTEIEPATDGQGGVFATAHFAVADGALVHADVPNQRKTK